MKIANSNVELSSHHEQFEKHEQREQLRVWHGDNEITATSELTIEKGNLARQSLSETQTPPPAVALSEEALALQPSKAIVPAEKSVQEITAADEFKISLLQLLVERMTGKELEIFKPEEIAQSPVAQAPASGAESDAGFGLIYDYYESHYESEFTSFSATADVTTQDGMTIRIEVELNMSREFVTEQSLNIRAGDALKDPLTLNFNGTAAELTQTKFSFDIDADGREEQISFVAPGSGFLALDKNGDGRINDGSELFGPTTNNGFAELAAYDSDGNSWIDENDSIYSRLRIWSKDTAGNDQLMALGERNVGAIYLGHVDTPFLLKDQNNEQLGQISSSGLFLKEDGTAATIQQLDLVV